MHRYDNEEEIRGQRQYLHKHGWHFSKKACEHAVSKMKDRSGKTTDPYTKEEVDQLLKKFGVELENNHEYDACYVANMGKSDYLSSSIPNEQHLALYIKNVLDDKDGYEGIALTRYFADCIAKGVPFMWEEFI